MSASDFLQLLGDKASAKGLTDGGSHNALLVAAAPQDTLATAVLKVASGTQVRGWGGGRGATIGHLCLLTKAWKVMRQDCWLLWLHCLCLPSRRAAGAASGSSRSMCLQHS
jgi:hypothetical protein